MTWLLPCLAGTAITAVVGFTFKSWFNAEGQAGTEIFLVAFLFAPMIAAISGNAGLQTSAIVISGLATGDLAALKLRQVFMREARIALMVALCCGLIGGLICSILPTFFEHRAAVGNRPEAVIQHADVVPEIPVLEANQYIRIAIAFGLAMFSAIMVSTTLGLFLPFVFRHIGLDPAISSGPLVTTANDSISVAIYLFLTMLLTT